MSVRAALESGEPPSGRTPTLEDFKDAVEASFQLIEPSLDLPGVGREALPLGARHLARAAIPC
ncbi:MAG: hypothetical protein U0794_06415 [Isosphaeraceae bacterium]